MLGARMLMSAAARRNYRDLILSDNPVAYWPFNETSGTTAFDATGNGHDGTHQGGLTLGVGSPAGIQGAYDFDGSTARVVVPDAPGIRLTFPFTVEVWIYPKSWDASNHNRVIDKGAYGTSMVGYAIASEFTSTNLIGRYGDGVTSSGNDATSTVTPGIFSWHHIIYRADSGVQELILDQTTIATSSYTSPITHDSRSLAFGSQGGAAAQLYHGRIAAPALYDRALTDQELSAHRSAGLGI